jgi:hypothetical protein
MKQSDTTRGEPDPPARPQVVRVDVATLRALHTALEHHASDSEPELLADLEHLIETARWRGEGL